MSDIGIGHMAVASKTNSALTFTFVDVSPNVAQAWLATRNELNRTISEGPVQKYASDMSEGRWSLTHQCIAFDSLGNLIDGQHRLSAVIQSGCTIKFAVAKYLNQEVAERAKMTCDTGRTKTVGCVLEMSAVTPKGTGKSVAAVVAAISEIMNGDRRLSPDQVRAEYVKRKEAIDWSVDAMPVNEFSAPIRAAFVYAYPVDREKVKTLATMLREKCGYEQGSAAHVFVKSHEDMRGLARGGTDLRKNVMLKALRLIQLHIEGQPGPLKLQITMAGADYFKKRLTTIASK